MRSGDDIEMIEGLPVLYIRSLKALVVSDLHFGYEGGMVKGGRCDTEGKPQKHSRILGKAFGGRVEAVIVVGDIKNDFSG